MLVPCMKLQNMFGDKKTAEKIATWALKNPEEFWLLINSVSTDDIKNGVVNPEHLN